MNQSSGYQEKIQYDRRSWMQRRKRPPSSSLLRSSRCFHHISRQSLLALLSVIVVLYGPSECQAKKSIPRSINSSFHPDYLPDTGDDMDMYSYHLWNPSPKIDRHGFLTEHYFRIQGEWEVPTQIPGRHGTRNSVVQLSKSPVIIRQVPGDGNCLFHSLSVALSAIEDRSHLNMKWKPRHGTGRGGASTRHRQAFWNRGKRRSFMSLNERSTALRQLAVNALLPRYARKNGNESEKSSQKQTSRRRRDRLFFLQGTEYLPANELLDYVASQYGLSGEEYCDYMKRDGYWGGGPEIVALCNELRRPIHVYELISTRFDIEEQNSTKDPKKKRIRKSHKNDADTISDSDDKGVKGRDTLYQTIWKRSMGLFFHKSNIRTEFRLRRMACFGSPKFDNREPLHILSADCRFPDIHPGQESSNGNHFLAMFPKGSSGWRKYQRLMKKDKETQMQCR